MYADAGAGKQWVLWQDVEFLFLGCLCIWQDANLKNIGKGSRLQSTSVLASPSLEYLALL